jgi:hypothetical protein
MSSFESVWASLHHTAIVKPGMLQRALRAKKAACPKLHSGACPVHASSNAKSLVEHAGHLAAWCDLLQQSFIARYLLRQHSWHTGKLLKECDECNRTNWQSNLRFFIRGQARPQYLRAVPYPWQGYRVALERRWREGTRPATSQVQRRSSDAVRYETADEQSFLIRALAYTRCSEGDAFNPPPIDDTEFESLLVQYLRIKTAVFRLLVHAPGEHGLVPFLTHFSQIKIYAPDAEKLRPQPRSEPGLSVAATEYRVAPDAWLNHHRRFTRAVEDRVVPRPVGEVAWLVHLKREKQVPKELPLFGTALRGFENDEDRIGRLIESYPETLRHLRGIDIAGVERHQPLWVSTDALRRLRKRADGIAGSSVKRGVQPLGLTLHVGEDFEWLTSGIRAVAEPIEWGMLTRGDRLGHAIAITSEPEKWWERRTGRAIETTRFERLLDLAFLAKYTDKLEEEESEKRTPEQETWLIAEISPLVSAIWPGLTTAQLPENPIEFAEKLWKALGSKSMHVLMNRRTSPGGSFPEAWLYRYLWNLSTRDRANHVIRLKVEPSPEIKLVMLARNRVIRQLSCRQICIESNPTSNLVVAGLDAIAAQKVLHHRFSQGDGSPKFRLPWTISTDDPISFSTSLADEYAYAWAGMALEFPEPCEPCDARALLDEAAATSMRMRFATPDDSGKDSNATRAPRSE